MSDEQVLPGLAGASAGAAVEVTTFDLGGDVRAEATVEEYDRVRDDGEAVIVEADGEEQRRLSNARITAVEATDSGEESSLAAAGRCPRCESELALGEPYVDPDDPLRVKAALECQGCFFAADAALAVVDVAERGGT